MGYEKFTKQRRPAKDQAMITVLKGGQLGINKMCMEEYFRDYKYVEMYYDKDQKKIGIRPTNDSTNDAYNVRLIKGGKLANISVKEFLKHFGIEHGKSIAYSATWNEKEKLVEVDIK
jgi:hypothetical protein